MKRSRSLGGFAVTLVVFVWTCGIARVYPQGPLFVPAPASPVIVGPGSGQVLLADVNRDGLLDLVTQHLLNRVVAVHLGDGKGHFVPLSQGPMGLSYQPGAIALGDVNNDGLLDLAVASRDSGKERVAIFLGNGRGGFSLAAGSPFPASAAMKLYKPILRFADINKDGKLDLATANGRRNTIAIFFGNGRGGFSAGPIVKLESGHNFYSFAVDDVDRDGHLDLVTASSPGPNLGAGRVATRRGDGTGAFQDAPGSLLSVLPDPRLAALADVNGDHRPDVVLSHGDSNLLSVLLNDGGGSFVPAPGSPINIGRQPFALIVADVNRDRKADLLAATVKSDAAPFESRIVVLVGNNRGFLPAPGSPFPAGSGAYNLTVGDVDGDGKLDVAASSFEGDAVTLLLGR